VCSGLHADIWIILNSYFFIKEKFDSETLILDLIVMVGKKV